MIFHYKGRRVETDGIQGNNDEFYVEKAYFLDGDERELNGEELEELAELNACAISEAIHERYAAEAYDRWKDSRYE